MATIGIRIIINIIITIGLNKLPYIIYIIGYFTRINQIHMRGVRMVKLGALKRLVGKSNTKKDKLYIAKPPGYRKAKSGNVYHESRRNRSDLNKKKKL